MSQISVSSVAVRFGDTTLLENVTFTIDRGQRWGVVGRNGSGKTTLFHLLTGDAEPTTGLVARESGVRISLLDQHRAFPGAVTVWEAAAGPFADLLALERALERHTTELGALGDQAPQKLLDHYSRDLERFEREGGYTFAPRVDAVLHGLGFDPVDARTRRLDTLSGGERGRVGLAQQLAAPADILLLDEPTNHLDLDTTAWLEDYLRQLDATVLVVSHDRAFLAAISDHILHLENRSAFAYAGGYHAFVAQRAERRLAQERAFRKQSKTIASEEDFIRRNIAGQKTSQAKGRRRRLERVERLSPPPGEAGAMSLRLEAASRGGDQVVTAANLTVGFEGRTLLREFSARIMRGDVIGLVGPNGAGKSTLLRTLLGDRPAQGGEARLGDSIRAAWYRQDLSQVPPDREIFDIIHDLRPSWTRGQVQGHLGRFDFPGDAVRRTTATMSGGERARVALAIIMLSGANLLVFDEPTNHLDVESIEALEDALEEFDGTVLLVSHDRALLRNLTTRLWVLHHERITDYPGGFEEWETVSAERAHAARVAAQEEEALRRVQEKKQTRRSEPRGGAASPRRAAQRALEEAEALVAAKEAVVERIRAELENPELYQQPAGARRAAELGKALEVAKRELEAAFAVWEGASQG